MHLVDEDDHAEEAEHDGRHGREAFDGQPDAFRQAVFPCIFGEIDASAERERDGDGHGQEQHVEGVEELAADAAAREDVARFAEDEVEVQHREAFVEDVAEEGGEQAEDETSDEPEADFGDFILDFCVHHPATTFFDVK